MVTIVIPSVVLLNSSRLHAQQNNPLSPSESALPQNPSVTRLESALPKSLDLKSFRIRTYKKWRGEGGKLLTRDQRTFMIRHLFRIAGFAPVVGAAPSCGLACATLPSTDCYLTYAKPQRNVPLVFSSVFLVVLSHDFSDEFVGSPEHLWRTLHFGARPRVDGVVRSIL